MRKILPHLAAFSPVTLALTMGVAGMLAWLPNPAAAQPQPRPALGGQLVRSGCKGLPAGAEAPAPVRAAAAPRG